MQCSACRAVFSNGLDVCPRCKSLLPPAKANSSAITTPPISPTAETHGAAPPAETARASSSAPTMIAPTVTTTVVSQGETAAVAVAAKPSTLLEFPGTARGNNNQARPQWRKDLSDRVREIQERRAREAEEATYLRTTPPIEPEPPDVSMQGLGLLPAPEAPPVNPLVAAALRRIERARQPPAVPPRPRSSSGGAATAAVARFAEEQYHQASSLTEPLTLGAAVSEQSTAERTNQAIRQHNLTVIAPKPPATKTESVKTETAPAKTEGKVELKASVPLTSAPHTTPATVAPEVKTKAESNSAASAPTQRVQSPSVADAVAATTQTQTRAPRRVFDGVVDDAMLARREAGTTETVAAGDPHVNAWDNYDDRAPFVIRLAASLVDLLLIAFASSPFAAIIELTNGDWSDKRVMAAMAGIVLVVTFLYSCVSTLLAGRTWGMTLVSLHVVDAETNHAPDSKQAVTRALTFIVSLLVGGLGLLYAFFDAEGRTLHDHLSRTIVVRD